MGVLFDSGWVPQASGTINAAVETGNCSQVSVFIAASGAAGAGTTTAGWSAGAMTPVPWIKSRPDYPCAPLITGSYSVSAPGAGAVSQYYIGVPISGTSELGPFVPTGVYVSTVAGAASWARVIVEGK